MDVRLTGATIQVGAISAQGEVTIATGPGGPTLTIDPTTRTITIQDVPGSAMAWTVPFDDLGDVLTAAMAAQRGRQHATA